MTNELMLSLIVLIPLLGALCNGFLLRSASVVWACAVSTLAIALPFGLAAYLFFTASVPNEVISVSLFPWISVPFVDGSSFHLFYALTLDRLSVLFILIITGVGSLIHLYSGGYMSHEPRVYRFFAYLNLFIFSMLTLVLGSNMLVTFVGWEGVGVCSYLLIGYWYEDEANSMAAIKAFVVNRVGDVGFLLAMFFSFQLFHTLTYSEISTFVTQAPVEFFTTHATALTCMGLSLLLAVAGKSAQIPLYTWLPDAMAGPTPVSALIHAATMVTAGIYLMTRTSFLLVESSVTMTTIACVGAATALFSATIGLAQTDIKRVLAYSTCSQLGYMVLACGVGLFQYGVAHVMTHAFFKACLFLGAGSVIYALHHEQDIRHMGGLFKKMPVTAVTFLLATLAIIGFPGFSGFFSKDAILAAAWTGPFGHPAFWVVGVVTAGLTAFYMLRLTYLVFFGECRAHHPEKIHENHLGMTLPLIILAALSVVGGVVALPEIWTGRADLISEFLEPVLQPAQQVLSKVQVGHNAHLSPVAEGGLMGVSVAVVLLCALFAISVYRPGIFGAQKFTSRIPVLYALVRDKWRIDELYQCVIVRPLARLGEIFYSVIDRRVIESAVNGFPEFLYAGTSVASDAQSGIVRSYLKLIFVGIVVFGVVLFI